MGDREIEPRGAAGRGPAQGLDVPASRRRFVGLVGGTGAAAALSTLAAACGGEDEETATQAEAPAPGDPATDLEIVNYALFLELLEEEFYTQVLESGAISDPRLRSLTGSIRKNETEHVDLLTGVVEQLGGSPVNRPDTKFDAIIDAGEEKILETAAMIENLGAAAYLGQADRIEDGRVLETALSIHTVEARHAAALNEIAGNGFSDGELKGSIPDGAFAEAMTRGDVLRAAAPYFKS